MMQSNIIIPTDHASSIKALLSDPIFQQIPPTNIARILPYVTEMVFEPGDMLYTKGERSDKFFYLLSGTVEFISNEKEIKFDGHRIGQEAGTDFKNYLTDAMAVSKVIALVIPRKNLWTLFNSTPKLRSEFYLSLMKSLSSDHLDGHDTIEHSAAIPSTKEAQVDTTKLIGWLITLFTPALVLYFASDWGIDKNSVYFLAILFSSIMMWVFSLVDEYIPGIFAILASLAMQLVPVNVVLSGLASDGFMLAMSMLGISVIIVSSGLSYRVLLLMLNYLPNSPFWQNLSLLLVGFALTPLIPSINGRVSLITPLMSDMMEILHQQSKGPAANKLSVAAFTGVSLLSGMFLSSKSVNFVVLGMLPDQIQDQYQWGSWFIAAGATGIALLILYFILDAWMFDDAETSPMSKEQVAVQLSLLGKMQYREWAGVIGVVVFILGMITLSIHRIASPWIGLLILFGSLLLEALNKTEFREKIDWPFLMYLGGIGGITSSISYLGLEKLIANSVPWLGEYMQTNFYLFVFILMLITFIVRLVVPISTSIVILASILMPVAIHYGINPWVVGFIILITGEMWFFPYQCSYYLQYRQLTRGLLFDETKFLTFNAILNVTKVVAIYASIPYWQWMGLL